ncbi:hypothetical protein EG68_12184 [Paragonimus skrjabini miyazakii]|uniref:Uncharacterized protein n=1 Tax=Paragonimus skrjabini miyazakii TaxID=59628 RepID=A0A8S9YII3_9TREM|nr:hypothetical protein EG68_12184 [Paragonimus skrjabini miyazakii]
MSNRNRLDFSTSHHTNSVMHYSLRIMDAVIAGVSNVKKNLPPDKSSCTQAGVVTETIIMKSAIIPSDYLHLLNVTPVAHGTACTGCWDFLLFETRTYFLYYC